MKINIISREENKIFRNKVNSIVRNAKTSYYKTKFRSYQSDVKNTWSLINDIISPNRNKCKNLKLTICNREISNTQEITEIFNTHFSSIAHNLLNNISHTSLNAIELVPPSPQSFFLSPVRFSECEKIIDSLKNSKTSTDELPVKIFQSNSHLISPTISKLINRCFSSTTFPSCLKIAIIRPIFKRGNPNNVSNYRPISILPYIAKIIEKCIYNRILYFFTSNNLITNSQFGFLPNNSTVDALNSFIEFQYNALNYSQYALNVFVDLSKAFDTIDHQILLGKLDKYGVRGLPLELIRSYISDRKYRVSIDGNISNASTSNIGTAQGSILAPLLFIIYMNDLPNYLPNSFTILYADDTTLCYKNNSLMSAIDQCNSELLKFSLWCQANKLTINLDKTCYMIVSNRKIPDLNVSLKMNNIPINLTHSHKFLGVTFDDQLKFNLHIADISTKISKSVGIIYKLSNVLPNSTLLNIYHALVNLHIMYCNVIWGLLMILTSKL